MATIIKLDEYLKRQKELFNAYITSSGQEVSVMPFASSYNQQDNKTYTGDDLLRYIDSYTKGNLITNEELDKYNNTKKMPNDLIFKRGRIIIEAIIASHGDTKNLDRLGRDFAKKDGRLHPYDNKYLLKCRDYYLKNSKNEDLINAYKNVCELVARGTYDIELPLKILEMQDNKKAISFINRINISKSSLRKLVNEYETLYPANTANITRLNYLLKEAYKTGSDLVKFYEAKVSHDTIKDRLTALRRMLEDYLISDIEDISDLFDKYGFNSYKFTETIKDALSSKDMLLHSLINKLEAKTLSINNSYKEILTKIMQAKYNGINYGYGYREFNTYDYYMLKNGVDRDKLIEYANKIYEADDANAIISVISEYEVDSQLSREELETFYQSSDSSLILDYLEYSNIPLSLETFRAVQTRFHENDISFEVIEPKKVANM